MEIHIEIIGWLLMPLSLIHILFPKRFDWKKELIGLSLINRQMMFVHTFFIALMIFLNALLCITSASELVQTSFGQTISLGLGIFWGARLAAQFFGYSSALWKRKTFETVMHILFTLLWTYLSVVFMGTYFGGY